MKRLHRKRTGIEQRSGFEQKNLIKLMRYCRRHAVALVVVVMLSVAAVFLTVYATTFLKTLTNYISDAARQATENEGISMRQVLDLGYIVRLCLVLAAMYGSSAICGFLQAFFMTGVNQKIARRLRTDISAKINRLPIAYFDNRQVGDTLSRVTNDVDTIAQSLNSAVATAVSAVVQIVLVTVFMLLSGWQMTLTALTTVPLSLVLLLVVVRSSQKFFRRQQTELGALNGTAEECYTGLAVIRAFNAEQRMAQKFERQNLKLKKAMNRANVLSGISHPLTTFVGKLGYVAICVVGGILMANGQTDLGSLAAFLIYINLFQSPLSQIGQIASVFQTAAAASGRVFEFLEEEEQPDESEKTVELVPTSTRGQVDFCNVRFGYSSKQTVINDFSATIEAGQKVAIVGPTGAGKTTLVNLLMRFYETAGGEIQIDGEPIQAMRRENVRALFSMVLQDTWTFSGTIAENIRYAAPNISDDKLREVAESAEILHYIESLPNGFDTEIGEDDMLSTGQKQLLTIARAMACDAPMMILDEATSNVDTRTEEQIQKAMDRLCAGKTSFVIAHRLSTIKNADLILVMKDGDVLEKGNHMQLLSQNGCYAELYNSQFAK